MPKLLVIDTSYGYEAIRDRKLEDSVTCRDLGGFFEHVWTVHPVASLVAERSTKEGPAEWHALAPRHTFVDGKFGRTPLLGKVPFANFFASQAELVAKLVALVRRERIGVVRAGDPLYAGLVALAVAKTCRIPLLVRMNANYDKLVAATGHAMMPRLFRTYGVEKRVMRFVLSQADVVAAVNQDNLEFALKYGARKDRATIFRYGNLLDKRHIAPPETRDRSGAALDGLWPRERPFLLHAGRLEAAKFPDDPLRVLAQLRSRGRDLGLVMVGDGGDRASLGSLAEELGIADHVAFVGNRDQEWLSRVFPIATCVLSPLTGRALSEAAFGGAPIVAYDLDWQGELIRSGQTGELVPFRSRDQMTDAVERFLDDPAYAARMGRAARQRAFELLDPATLDAHERRTYEALFSHSPIPPPPSLR